MIAYPALTIWQPWASLIAAGAKPYEWRGWPAPRRLIGQRIAVHAGARKVVVGEISETLKEPSGRVRSGQAGAKARAKRLTSDERSAIARKAASARWV